VSLCDLLHEYDIRKAKKEFVVLINEQMRNNFMSDLNVLIGNAPFAVIGMVIEKKMLKDKYSDPANPYHIALGFGFERVYSFLRNRRMGIKTLPIKSEKPRCSPRHRRRPGFPDPLD
jgi:hypothetical protein